MASVKVNIAQSCLIRDPVNYTVHGILQARILEWVAYPFSIRSSQSRNWTGVSHIAGRFFTNLSHQENSRILEWVAYPFSNWSFRPKNWTGVSCIAGRSFTNWAIREDPTVKVTQSCPTLCNPMDYMVHGILQARILEWVAIPFSRGSSQPRDQTQVSHIAGGSFTSWATREAHEVAYVLL